MVVSRSDLPSKRICPASMGTSPAIMLISVDLPQPFGPKMETMRALGRFRSKFSYSGVPAKYLVRPRMVMWVPTGPGTKAGSRASAGAGRRSIVSWLMGVSSSPAPMDDGFLDEQEQHVQQIAQRAGR